MNDIKSLLASEGIKSFLQKEFQNPLRFLEGKIKESESHYEERINLLDDNIKCVEEEMPGLRMEIKRLKDGNRALQMELGECKSKVEEKASRAAVVNELETQKNQIAILEEEIAKEIDRGDYRHDNNKLMLHELKEKGRLDEIEMQLMKDSVASCLSKMNQMRQADTEYQSANDKAREDFAFLFDRMKESIDGEQKASAQRLEKMEAVIFKADKRLKKETVELSRDMVMRFDDFQEEFDSKMKALVYKRKNTEEELDRIEHQLLKALKSDRGGKKAEVSLKQSRENADKIEKIEKALEEM